ncbi:hypothetical protein [Bacillus horti]|uniref:Uncharacterized protein n=1 Tax=Caldalkalibacillus horti TaxID=77523 RepID=A0ABT9VYX1_9BACI|nr:hypothetical protein [Bacillus horti]MDQ0166198.1 hypothetical protein [Bacillus horti]
MELDVGKGMYVTNHCEENIYLLQMPNKDWEWSDVGFGMLSTLYSLESTSMSTITAINSLSKLQTVIFTVKKALGNLSRTVQTVAVTNKSMESTVSTGGNDTYRKAAEARREIIKFFEREGLLIQPHEHMEVSNKKNDNPVRISGPSDCNSIFGYSESTLLIVTESLSRISLLRTNNDWSWIVEPGMIIRSKEAHFSLPDKEAGYYRFSAFNKQLLGV